jgi:hypothetical protein
MSQTPNYTLYYYVVGSKYNAAVPNQARVQCLLVKIPTPYSGKLMGEKSRKKLIL